MKPIGCFKMRKTKAKRKITKKSEVKQGKKLKGIYGLLLIVFFIYLLSLFSLVYMLSQRVSLVLAKSAGLGIYITLFLSLFYLFFLIYSIVLMVRMKKKFIRTSIAALSLGIVFSLWYYIVGYSLFNPPNPPLFFNNLASFTFNLLLSVGIIIYLKKSSRVRNTFVR